MVQHKVRPAPYIESLPYNGGETTCLVECSVNSGTSIYGRKT